MVSRLLRALSAGTENEPARIDRRQQARASWRQLEIALQQFTDNGAQLERARFFVQRSRLPDRLRVRLRWIGRSAGDVRVWRPRGINNAFGERVPPRQKESRHDRRLSKN